MTRALHFGVVTNGRKTGCVLDREKRITDTLNSLEARMPHFELCQIKTQCLEHNVEEPIIALIPFNEQ